MSYHPYLRGKQYELICVKENAELLSVSGFCPIIEPVRDDLGSLIRCLSEVEKYGGRARVVANPGCGPLKGGFPKDFKEGLSALIEGSKGLSWLYRSQGLIDKSVAIPVGNAAVLHDGPADGADVRKFGVNSGVVLTPNIFIDNKDPGTLYRRQFKAEERVLLRDGFRRKKNSEYLEPEIEHFSDLHLTYEEEGMQGFGDFLTVGDYYADGGGAAYAVAIHLTFVDEDNESSMFIRHFVSDSNLTPADPAGKFSEALDKLAGAVRAPGSKILQTEAVDEFLELHDRSHYPGLGYVKKLSMQHHMELMAETIHG